MQDTQNNHRLQGHLLGAFSVLVWGTTFVATKVLLRTFSPIEIMIARFALGFLALLIVGRGLIRQIVTPVEAVQTDCGVIRYA